jgi:hypothetical protein
MRRERGEDGKKGREAQLKMRGVSLGKKSSYFGWIKTVQHPKHISATRYSEAFFGCKHISALSA